MLENSSLQCNKLKSLPKEESKAEFLPKADFYKANEKEAISKFVEQNPEMKDSWSDLVQHYSGKRGRDTVSNIVQDLDDAKTLFQKYSPAKESEDKEAKANLSKDASAPHTTGGGEQKKRGGIIPKSTPVSEWYKTE